jgi:hypothetical protein
MAIVPLSVAEQERRLRELYPDFRSVLHTDWIGVWEGPLLPIMQTWRIRILYFSQRDFGDWFLANRYVTVTVLDPPVGRDPRGTGEPPPHVYRLGYPPDFPALCLYDPAAGEWSPEAYIAETIIPWTIEWLYWFEVWLLTGEWKGGGRHPEPESEPCPLTENSAPESGARRERSRSAAFHRIGRLIGVFASLPLMAAASAGSSRPLSSRNWSGAIPAGAPLGSISILSPEHRPAASSRLGLAPDTPQSIFSTCMSAAAMRSSLHCPTVSSAG